MTTKAQPQPHKWLPYQIFRLKNRKERPNRSSNNEDMTERANRYVVCEGGSESLSDTLVKKS